MYCLQYVEFSKKLLSCCGFTTFFTPIFISGQKHLKHTMIEMPESVYTSEDMFFNSNNKTTILSVELEQESYWMLQQKLQNLLLFQQNLFVFQQNIL